MTDTMRVPFVDLPAQQREVNAEILPELAHLLETAGFIGGAPVADFESAYADFVGVPHCIGVGNGTDAIEISLRAAGIGAGDEVIIPANTFIATAEAIIRTGATPVLVDVDEDALLIDPAATEAAISERTRAIVPVHLYGQLAAMEQLAPVAARAGAILIEDAAQSQGATRFGEVSGSLGTLGATSFYPGKNLGAAGDAGAITTDDAELAERARSIGAHGSLHKYVHDRLGFNSRLDAIQACVLRHKLARLPQWNERRRAVAARYAEFFADVDEITPPATLHGNEHVWHLYVVRVDGREEVASRLAENGVATSIHYPTPLHRSPALEGRIKIGGALDVAEHSAARILSLPMFPHLRDEQVEYVARTLTDAVVRRELTAA